MIINKRTNINVKSEYEKPHPEKYKEMAKDFKSRINKKFVFFKDHPFFKNE